MSQVFLFILGCLDVSVGLALILNKPVLILAILSSAKGVWTLITSLKDPGGLLLGIIDLLAGIFLLLLLKGYTISAASFIGIVILVKGLYSVGSSIFSISSFLSRLKQIA